LKFLFFFLTVQAREKIELEERLQRERELAAQLEKDRLAALEEKRRQQVI
jgi:hypothetical protein